MGHTDRDVRRCAVGAIRRMLQVGIDKSRVKVTTGLSLSASDAASTVSEALGKLDSTDVRMRRVAVGAVAEAVLVLETLLLRKRRSWWQLEAEAEVSRQACASAVAECKTFRFRFVQHPEFPAFRVPNEFFHVPATMAAPPEDEEPPEWESLDALLDHLMRQERELQQRATELESKEATLSKHLRQSAEEVEKERSLLDSLRARVLSSEAGDDDGEG